MIKLKLNSCDKSDIQSIEEKHPHKLLTLPLGLFAE